MRNLLVERLNAGALSSLQRFEQLQPLGKPLICAGGIGAPETFSEALSMGYAGAQLGTRFIASKECNAHADYKNTIVAAVEDDIVLTEKISGVPVSVIRTDYIDAVGTGAGPIARWMLRGRTIKHWMRTIYTLQSLWKFKRANLQGTQYRNYFQAGKSVTGIHRIKTAAEIVLELSEQAGAPASAT